MKIDTKKTLLLVILASLFIFSGCKKYEDGPYLSFKSKLNRLEGEWRIVTLNGDDVFSNIPKLYFKFEKDGTFYRTEKTDIDTYTDQGTWIWSNHKEVIEVALRYSDVVEKFDYQITKLTTSSLWIKDNEANRMEFQKE